MDGLQAAHERPAEVGAEHGSGDDVGRFAAVAGGHEVGVGEQVGLPLPHLQAGDGDRDGLTTRRGDVRDQSLIGLHSAAAFNSCSAIATATAAT